MSKKGHGILRMMGAEALADTAASAAMAIPVPVVDVLAAGVVRKGVKKAVLGDDGPQGM